MAGWAPLGVSCSRLRIPGGSRTTLLSSMSPTLLNASADAPLGMCASSKKISIFRIRVIVSTRENGHKTKWALWGVHLMRVGTPVAEPFGRPLLRIFAEQFPVCHQISHPSLLLPQPGQNENTYYGGERPITSDMLAASPGSRVSLERGMRSARRRWRRSGRLRSSKFAKDYAGNARGRDLQEK
jgi:hypothetical protein